MSKCRIMGLFSDFEEAFCAISDIKEGKLSGVSIDDVTLKSPIEHPEIEEVLGERSAPVPYFTLAGAIFGITFGFTFLSSAQANFLVQPQGGKPVVPLPSNIVLTYEMMILFAVLFTVTSLMVCGRFMTKRSSLYSEKVCIDQIGVIVEMDEADLESTKELFKKHKVLEIREEVKQ
ncbi:MAG: DUF3341 domain-containing protein [Gammaproteobacteria bacterium]|nr:DUF3341 domain-containing protein [Gammaproteobacteria bacterium]